MAWSIPANFTAGQTAGVSTALNAMLANLAIIGGARTSYTTTWTQVTANPTLGNGTLTAEFRRVDKEVDFLIQLTIGSSTVLGTGNFQFTLPVTAKRTSWSAFGSALDVSVSSAIGIPIAAEAISTTAIRLRMWPTTAGDPYTTLTEARPISTPATGDVYTIQGRYEAA